MPFRPACSCMIADHESHLLPPRIKPCGEMLLAFDFPPDPPLCALASSFPAVPAFPIATANPSYAWHSRSSHFCRSALALLFHQPVVWAAALLLHSACSSTPGRQVHSLPTTQAMHHNPSFSVLWTFCSAGSCSSQAAPPSQ